MSFRCPTCGECFPPDARFCPFDGAALEPGAGEPLESPGYRSEAMRDPLLGSTIDGRYEVIGVLGEGGTGRVYKVRHTALGRFFAMKILRPDLARDEVLAARFIQEARATASVRHPNVIQITDFGRLPDQGPFLVTELLVGQTLRDVIKTGGAIPLVRATRIIKQIAAALGAAHAAGIVHRDLKPDNVFLVDAPSRGGTKDVDDVGSGPRVDEVRVVDFGAAKVVGASRVTRDGIVFGTPHYMSPEQASGQPVDHRSDIYSLGVIMYEMFTGRVPFEADTYMGVLTQHMFVQPLPPSRAAVGARELGALEQITLRCLAKKPEERYPSMESVAAEVDRAVRVGSPGRAETASEPVSASGQAVSSVFASKRATPWGWLVGGGLLLVVVLSMWVWVGHDGEHQTKAQSGAARPSPPALAPEETATIGAAPSIPPPPVVAVPPTETAVSLPSASAGTSRPRRQPPRPRTIGIDDVGDPFTVRR